MNDNDYIILFDQNGSPYIAHASLSAVRQRTAGALRAVGNAANTAREGVGRGVRATHKYIDKVVENGKTRYFYTQEELKAYYNEKKGQVNQKVGEAQEKAEVARLRMQRLGNEFKDKAQNIASEAKASASKVKDKLNNSYNTKSTDLAEPLPPNIPNNEPKKPNAPKKIEVKDKKGLSALREKLSSMNGTPGNGVDDNGETRSMLGSYAFNIPSDPKKLKEWADNGKQQAQKIMAEVEKEFKEFQKDYEAGKYGQTEMWIAQGIMDDLQDEMAEWEALSNMDEQALAQLFGPLIKKK